MKAFIKKIIGANSGFGFAVRVRLTKTISFVGLSRFLCENTPRPYFRNDTRLFRLLYGLEQTRNLGGAIAEAGVGSGRGMFFSLSYLNQQRDPRPYHAFDTFEGFPYISPEDLEGIPEERKAVSVVGRYSQYTLPHIKRLANRYEPSGGVEFHKGRFEDTMPGLPEDLKFSFVFLDCDLYQSYLTCLENLYPRTLAGGIILFDEYEDIVEWPGARKAIDEFFADKPEKPEPMPFGTSWCVRKQ
ncbi:TylF/MycF/NovP-related O-methyltransferase [Radicibacter daui]|uniref:TylF/MycF/NovP-related O-methyltransferase n=1 Tax=Radicibacter daui TaxID=3064829 RepID=UPI004046A61D